MTGGTIRADVRQRDRQHHGTHLEDEMPCCPDVYFCPTVGELECPRHRGFEVCCDQPGKHEPVDPAAWHRAAAADERAWLDSWIRMDRELAAARHVTRLSLVGWPLPQPADLSWLASPS